MKNKQTNKTRIIINPKFPTKEYLFFDSLYDVYVIFDYDSRENVIKTTARLKFFPGDEIKHDIKKIRFCKKNRVLEVIIKQELNDGNPTVTKMSSITHFDPKKGDVNAVKVVYTKDEDYVDKKECYKKDVANIQQPEVKDGNIFTIK